MNVQQVINMVGRMVMRRMINWGITKGVGLASGRGKTAAPMTPAERETANKGRDAVKLARRAARLNRR